MPIGISQLVSEILFWLTTPDSVDNLDVQISVQSGHLFPNWLGVSILPVNRMHAAPPSA